MLLVQKVRCFQFKISTFFEVSLVLAADLLSLLLPPVLTPRLAFPQACRAVSYLCGCGAFKTILLQGFIFSYQGRLYLFPAAFCSCLRFLSVLLSYRFVFPYGLLFTFLRWCFPHKNFVLCKYLVCLVFFTFFCLYLVILSCLVSSIFCPCEFIPFYFGSLLFWQHLKVGFS